jgi:hypothetical protein
VNSNSLISWLIARGGIDVEALYSRGALRVGVLVLWWRAGSGHSALRGSLGKTSATDVESSSSCRF